MFHFGRASCTVLLSFAGLVVSSQPDCCAQSQAAMGIVSGTIFDPSGARIRHADVSIESDGFKRDVQTDGEGRFSVSLPLGSYHLSIVAPGFAAYTGAVEVISGAAPIHLELPLKIAVRSEEIAVPVEDASSTSGNSNASSIVFRGPELQALSDDNDTFQKELAAMAGGTGQPAEFLVNGFSGGHVPPKQTIREVRINNNPYSAAYDRIGYGRAEISTQAGGDSLHGYTQISGNGSGLNSNNPYTGSEPASSAFDFVASLNGPFNKKTSFFTLVEQNWQNFNSLVNAFTLSTTPQPISEAVASPIHTFAGEMRIDRQVTKDNSFTGYYNFQQTSLTNGGLTGQVLPEAGYDNGTTTQTLQLSDNEIVTPKVVTESRFQYIRTRLQQNGFGGGPSIVIPGVVTGGGNSQQRLVDNQDAFEFQQTVSSDQGPHFLHFGARYRLFRDANLSAAFYNGQYTYPSIAAYTLKIPTQLTLYDGQPSANIITGDFGVYAEDEWRVAKNFTLDLGFRLESQSAIPDHLDPAPRIGFAWAIQRKSKPVLTIRGGAGYFYDRFAASNLLTSVRENGVSQRTFIEPSPGPPPTAGPPSPPSTAIQPPTSYTVSPDLRSELAFIAGTSLERTLGKRGRVSVTYAFIGGSHQWLSQDINAPLPGSGVRPLHQPQDIYRFTSNGNEDVHTLSSNFSFKVNSRVSLFSVGTLQFNRANTAGATSFPSDSYNLAQDYGRALLPEKQIFIEGTVKLPWKISTDFYLNAQSGIPYNITTGTDLNGDGIYNDRPAYATHPTASSILYANTPLGALDANPQPGEAIIPINAGNSPNFYFLQGTARRRFAVGPRPQALPAKPGDKSLPTIAPRPWQLSFAAEAANLLNHNNPAPPIGVLASPDFGRSITLANPFGANPAANRTITLRASFNF